MNFIKVLIVIWLTLALVVIAIGGGIYLLSILTKGMSFGATVATYAAAWLTACAFGVALLIKGN